MTNLDHFQKIIGFTFTDPRLLHQALVHRSSLNENRFSRSNERLEFLGDAVLELWVSHYLYQNFPSMPEGDLTNLRSLAVRTETLAQISKEIGLDQQVLLSKGEQAHHGRDNISILADTFESLLGAIYLDRGSDAVAAFLTKFLLPHLTTLSQKSIYKDPKSHFQELTQEKEGITPNYQTLEESGPDHQKIFKVGVFLNDRQIAIGSGPSKQKAEEAAAISALQTYL